MEQFTVENLYGNNKKTVDNKTQKAINLSFYLYTILFLDEDNLSPSKLKQQRKKKQTFFHKNCIIIKMPFDILRLKGPKNFNLYQTINYHTF